jgi:uncharacterized protein (TIGR03663 family)
LEKWVITSSSKSSGNKKTRTAVEAKGEGRLVAEASLPSDLPERYWRISAIVIFCIAAIFRLYNLNLVPLHHDEGVNGNFLVRLVREGAYQYDPGNYHGPTLYYFAALIPWIFRLLFGTAIRDNYGLTTVTIRLIPALFGLATIWLVFLLRRRLGTVATLAAALMLAISPGAVYLSRYFIHETLFVFFTLGVVVAALRFYEDRNPIYLILAAGSTALLFATKETAMISAAVLIIALASTQFYLLLYKRTSGKGKVKAKPGVRPNKYREFIELFGARNLAIWIALAVVVFLTLNVLFYSSFFTNFPKGVYDSLATFEFWTKTGKEAHVHPPTMYFKWLAKQEFLLLFLGAIGAAIAVLKPKNPFALFAGLWAFGLIAAYSLVPYKTPWLTLNFIVPLALVAGYAIQAMYLMDRSQLRLPALFMLAVVIIGTYQSVDLNFFNYDNDDSYYVYVYAHTKRGTIKLVDAIDKIAKQTNEGERIGITIISQDYWPLPWYLRNYTRVGYYGRMSPSNEPIIIASESQRAEVESTFGELYREVPSEEDAGSYPLRPGVNLLLFKRRGGFQP